MEVGSRASGVDPTARQREVARLIACGLTNRQIARELGISERTVGAHIQNILNKLGANNRAEIAAWSAQRPVGMEASVESSIPAHRAGATPPVLVRPASLNRTSSRRLILAAALALAVLPRSDGVVVDAPPSATVASQAGDLVYDAHFYPDGREFSLRYVIGETQASAVRMIGSGIEYAVLQPGGNTGNELAVDGLRQYFAEVELSVVPGSKISFWLGLSQDPHASGQHLITVNTQIEAMQMVYFSGYGSSSLALGPQVLLKGLQAGRRFRISALVKPPDYSIFLDGMRVIHLTHATPGTRHVPSFSVFGDSPGTVRLTAIRVYVLNSP